MAGDAPHGEATPNHNEGMDVTTRVLVADDHALVRRGTRDILDDHPQIEVVGEAANGQEAVDLAEGLQPDVILMDLGMPLLNGLEATRAIKASWPDIHILVLTIEDDDEYAVEAIAAGASGYLLKDVHDDALIEAVLAVGEGGAVIDPSMVTRLVEHVHSASTGDPASGTRASLTQREVEVLRLVADGLSNRQIGSRLGVSSRTAEVHLHHVFEKLGASSRTEAVTRALRLGLISLEDPV
jgi:DNA-binding NarL/FixJ family response regulator